MKKMKSVGLLTFHAAHNYGSVLQAYATKISIEKLGLHCETINFRFKEQKECYALYNFHGSLKSKLVNIYLLLFHAKRKCRYNRFEQFVVETMNQTVEVHNRAEILERLPQYDTWLCGGDQLWNIHVTEIANSQDVWGIYYLDFLSDQRRASFSTSIGNMKKAELEERKSLLEKFDYISSREAVGVEMLNSILNGNPNVEEVLDPVFLLDKEEWNNLAESEPIIRGKYILLYTIATRSRIDKWCMELLPFAKKQGLQIVYLSPKFKSTVKSVVSVMNAGPREFLNLYNNAEVVIADTFHALCFSIIFRKPFYVLSNKYYKDDIRKTSLVKKLKLEDRMIDDEMDLGKIDDYSIDYSMTEKILDSELKNTRKALRKAVDAE